MVTGATDSSVSVWDLWTGELVHTFAHAHEEAEITCMTFDTDGRRLITGARDGTVKTWNSQSGHNLQVRILTSPVHVCICNCTIRCLCTSLRALCLCKTLYMRPRSRNTYLRPDVIKKIERHDSTKTSLKKPFLVADTRL